MGWHMVLVWKYKYRSPAASDSTMTTKVANLLVEVGMHSILDVDLLSGTMGRRGFEHLRGFRTKHLIMKCFRSLILLFIWIKQFEMVCIARSSLQSFTIP
jgi:hypothetical protein